MIAEIIKYPNPILKKKSEEIKEITEEIKDFCQSLAKTMVESQGVGLSAPQVGELKRIIVIQTEEGGEENKFSSSATELLRRKSEGGKEARLFNFAVARVPEVFLNPKIIKKSKETEIGEEGCLSFPGFFLKVKRAKKVEIEALDLEGRKIQIKAEGLIARVFQHEIDHLEGILFINRIGVGRRIWELLKFYRQSKRLWI